MDVFALRDKVVSDYRHYIESFVRIQDERIDKYVREEFDKGTLWPDAILQLNPAYEPGPTLDELAARGTILQGTAEFFRGDRDKPLRLYRHQEEAIEIARRGEPFVVTTGTGSGKSLAYLVPIVDHVLRNQPEKHQVRAIIVYPMNALINSQFNALERYTKNKPATALRFDRYTGQEQNEARQRILDDPPHILLTNYVMLEYMMLRPAERHFTDRATANLEFLVLDEMHTYRGRQGADVAMLMRRLRERSGNRNLLNIGTSATVASGGKREDRRRAAAEVATKLFGVEVPITNVVDETLRRAIQVPSPATADAVRSAVEEPLPAADIAAFTRSPLAAWVESTFGLDDEDGRLVRKKPIRFVEGVTALSEASGLPRATCEEKLRAVLVLGNRLRNENGEPVFAFRLHQFLAAGGTVYATLEPSSTRYRTLEGQHYAPGKDGDRLLYPLVFCRLPFLTAEDDEDAKSTPGYIALNEDDLWSDDRASELPEYWYENDGGGSVKSQYRKHVPVKLKVAQDGQVDEGETVECWFEKSPLLLCMRCGAAYDLTERNDFKKLSRLSNTGRSTSTTLVSSSVIVKLREDAEVEREAQKLMSFTDNRQDASLQAGHFNDFVQVALVRAALYKALEERGSLEHSTVTQAVFKALSLDQTQYAKEAALWGPGKQRNEEAFQRLLDYRLYEDLRRGWRVAQPNLEQCGLLIIDYPGLTDMCVASEPWEKNELLKEATPAVRESVVRAFLDHLRREMAIDAKTLDHEEQFELRRKVEANLRDPWAMDDQDQLLESVVFVMAGGRPQSKRERSLDTTRSKPGKYLRDGRNWGLHRKLSADEAAKLIEALVEALRGNFLTVVITEQKQKGIQLLAGSLQWKLGGGTPPAPDPIRSKWMRSERLRKVERRANEFFAQLP